MRPDSCRCTTTSLSARYARSVAVRGQEARLQQLATIGLVAARQHVVDVGDHLVGQDVGQEPESAAIDADERDIARASASCAAKSRVPSPPIATMRSASCSNSSTGLRTRPVRQALDRGCAIDQHREPARAQVPGEQRQRVGDPGVFHLADQGNAREVIIHRDAGLFSMRRPDPRPQSLTLDERDC